LHNLKNRNVKTIRTRVGEYVYKQALEYTCRNKNWYNHFSQGSQVEHP
jgi:hypothetical protein